MIGLKTRYCAGLAGLGSVVLALTPAFAQVEAEPTPPANTAPRFVCEMDTNGEYTVMYRPEGQPSQNYPWATPRAMGGGWDAQRRCETISARLEQYRPEGLVELQTSVENGYDIVCAVTEASPNACSIVFTVPPGQNAIATRDSVFDNLTLANAGSDTDGVRTFAGDGSSVLDTIGQVLGTGTPQVERRSTTGLYLKPYLAPSDGGTGEMLTRPAGRRLNPADFR